MLQGLRACPINNKDFFPAILVGVIILFIRDRSYELRKKAKNKDNEVKPIHWARSMSVDHLKEIGRAFIQPALLLVIFSAVVRQIGKQLVDFC